MKKLNQSKKMTVEFLRESWLYRFLCEQPEMRATRKEIADKYGISDRVARKAMAELANYAAILSFSCAKGYRLAVIPKDADKNALRAFIEDVNHAINEHRSRITNIKARMKPLIAIKKVAEKLIEKEG